MKKHKVIEDDCIHDFVCFIVELSTKEVTPKEFLLRTKEALKTLKGDLEK